MKKLRLITLATLCMLFAACFAFSAGAETVANGTCGESLTWELTEDGTLTIFGSGNMVNYTWSNPSPWNSYRNSIKSVVIGDSVTTIVDYAFEYCYSLTSIEIPVDDNLDGDVTMKELNKFIASFR